MNSELLIPFLTFGGTLLLVLTGLLNFSVFVRQLRASREQLETARRLLESSRQQPQIQLVQRAMTETSDHLKILIEKPYLRPYFYENKTWKEGDVASHDEVKAMAELLLSNFASDRSSVKPGATRTFDEMLLMRDAPLRSRWPW